MPAPDEAVARSGRCAIVGRPNVGKSTLLNTMLGQKLAIATPRPGTTRRYLLGVYASASPPTQIAFVDTPGLARPRNALGEILKDEAHLGASEADAVVFMTDVSRRRGGAGTIPEDDLPALSFAQSLTVPRILVINKVDLLGDKDRLLPLISAYNEHTPFVATVPVSALNGENVDALIGEVRQLMPEGTLYEPDFVTDQPVRFFVAELVRESAMALTRQEVPLGIAVVIDSYLERDNITHIDATLIVEKSGHKGIVLGKGGQMIKQIGTDARREIEALLEKKVMLKLWVKVIEGWTSRAEHAHRIVKESST